MPKNKSKNGEEWLRGKIREQAKLIRQLEKQLKYYQRQAHGESQDEEISTDTEDTYPEIKEITRYCMDCGKGKLRIFEIVGRVFEECTLCKYRKKINDIKK